MNRTPRRSYPNLFTWRQAQRLTQRDAAALLEMSQAQYCGLERGARATTGPKAKRIMEVTGVPLELLVGAA